MTTKLSMQRDINGFNSFILSPTIDKQNTILAAGVAQGFTAPTAADNYVAIFAFQPGATVWVATGVTATLPGASVAITVSEQNPAGLKVASGATISMITNNTTAEVGVKYYAI